MQRSNKIVLVCHCVLNQNAVICGWERAAGAFGFVKELVEAGVGIIQLPCPETQFAGLARPSCNYEDYNIPQYRSLCRELADSAAAQLRDYLRHGVVCCGLVGIQNSPSCAVSGQRGVFMEELFSRFSEMEVQMPYSEIPEEYRDGEGAISIHLKGLDIQYTGGSK